MRCNNYVTMGLDLKLCGVLVPETMNPAWKRRYDPIVCNEVVNESLGCPLP